jgi:uncharacterized repeat protein (TIGR03803 family)
MPSQAQRVTSVFRTTVLSGVTGLLIISAVATMPAQNSVPPSAAEAARMPQFAKRLAPATKRPASRPRPVSARQQPRRGAPEGPIYDNGPINGNTDAWAINFNFVTSDTITVSAGTVDAMTFGAWLIPGDTMTSVELSITSSPNGGTTYFDQIVNLTQDNCIGNQLGFNVCMMSANFTGPMLNAGTYWVNLQNAHIPSGDPAYWDENSGDGCSSDGCPSQAYNNAVGTIPSEAFTMEGSAGSPTCFESEENLQILFNFTQQQNGGHDPTGVVIDQAGNLYGTTTSGGNSGAGFAYKLTHHVGWLLDPLFNFFGGNNGGEPSGVILGRNGTLYGGAQGGIQNCGSDGSQDCGLVFNLTPGPTACLTALCSWNENVPYRFSSETDGSGVVNVTASDQQGNLYGTTTTGGTQDAGTVFELTPSGGSWTKTILYSFTGHNDGSNPSQVLVGNDGNLYGIAGGGNGVVFQLTSSGGQWTESVIHTFSGMDGYDPAYLVQDGAGNLYGIVSPYAGAIFELEKSSGWTFSKSFVQHECVPEDFPYDSLNNLIIDANGTLYGTGGGGENGKTRPGNPECTFTYIFKASHDSGGWHYQDLYFRDNVSFPAGGTLALDASGKLYGTTSGCGTNSAGTVWQFTP